MDAVAASAAPSVPMDAPANPPPANGTAWSDAMTAASNPENTGRAVAAKAPTPGATATPSAPNQSLAQPGVTASRIADTLGPVVAKPAAPPSGKAPSPAAKQPTAAVTAQLIDAIPASAPAATHKHVGDMPAAVAPIPAAIPATATVIPPSTAKPEAGVVAAASQKSATGVPRGPELKTAAQSEAVPTDAPAGAAGPAKPAATVAPLPALALAGTAPAAAAPATALPTTAAADQKPVLPATVAASIAAPVVPALPVAPPVAALPAAGATIAVAAASAPDHTAARVANRVAIGPLPLAAATGKAGLAETAQFAGAIGPVSDKTLSGAPSPAGAAGLLSGAMAPPLASPNSAVPPAQVPGLADASASIAATPAALAASITAMARDGHATAILRLDPPGLGQLAIHIELGAGSQINVQFVPSLAHTGHLLANGMDELRQNLANAGLTLGQSHIGAGLAGGGQTGSQGGYTGSDGGSSPRQQSGPGPNEQTYSNAAGAGPNGIRAYA